MKTIIMVLLLAFASAAFSSKYEEAMKANIDKMNQPTSSLELQNLGAQFERIGNAEPGKWLPNYYAAYCYIFSTVFDNMDNDAKKIQLDKAQVLIDKLTKNYSNESEIYTLQAFLFQLRITDMVSGAKYSGKASEAIATAEKLNPENPRVYYLRGSNTFHTPKFVGGGPDKAKPDLERAAAMFSSQKPNDPLMPTWGAYHNEQLLSECNKVEKRYGKE